MARTTAVYLFTVHFLSYIIVLPIIPILNVINEETKMNFILQVGRNGTFTSQNPLAFLLKKTTAEKKRRKKLDICRQDSGNNKPRDQSTVSESSRRFRTEFLEDWPQAPGSPYFDPSTPDNVTGLVGHPVTLFCKVKNLQNRTVSWVRHRDIHLLTVGRYTYTSDQRFEAQHKPRSEEWALRIRSPQRRDSGQYECQISTTPPIGHAVFLNIVEPETEILGGPDLFIYAGSTINLTCIVKHTPEPPNTINWTHRGKTINFDSTRGGISLVTEKGTHSSSRLLVQSARTSDAGAYQCAPDNALSASARVHVLTGETPAAMQGSAHWPSRLRLPIIVFISISLFKVTV